MPGRGRWGRCPSGRAQPTGARSRRDVGHSSARTERLAPTAAHPRRPNPRLTHRPQRRVLYSLGSMRSSSARKISSCSAIAARRAGSEAAPPVRSCSRPARTARIWRVARSRLSRGHRLDHDGALSDPDAPVAGPMEHPRGDSPLVAGSRGQDQFEHTGGDAVLDLPEVKLAPLRGPRQPRTAGRPRVDGSAMRRCTRALPFGRRCPTCRNGRCPR